MRSPLAIVCAALAAALPAQDAVAKLAAKAQLALVKSSTTANTGFTVRWGPAGDPGKAAAAAGAAAVALPAPGARGAASGSWSTDRQHARFDGDHGDEILVAGRRAIARDAKRAWSLRRARHADGSPAPFVPDVPALRSFLANQDLAPLHRDVGMLDDRPVEIFGTTLTAEQTTEAVWSGQLPEAWSTNSARLNLAALVAARGGDRTPPAPGGTIDVAVHFEAATGIVRRVVVRTWAVQEVMRGNRIAMRIDADGRPERVDPEEAAEDEAAAKQAATEPLRYEAGLPVRPRRGAVMHEYVVDLHGHGATEPPALDAAQRRLLGI